MKTPPLFLTNTIRADIDRNTTLCLACASSLPPLKTSGSQSGTSIGTQEVFITQCCTRPICPRCITGNPRLERYNPCLACLGGVGVVRSGSNTLIRPHVNIDGALRDEDTFVLGEDDDDSNVEFDDDKQGDRADEDDALQSAAPLPEVVDSEQNDIPTLDNTANNIPAEASAPNPPSLKYYIARIDTLQGIALRFGLDGREICRLNNLPPSTLSTTPHLLHTRRFLTLPPSASHHPDLSNTEEQREREAQHRRERAEKRLQTLTKEVDWRVAKAYIALADDPTDEAGEAEEYSRKRKEAGISSGPASVSSNLEERAIERYLDDEEWEAIQRRDGGKVGPSRFPSVKSSGEGSSACGENDRGDDRRWRQWKS